MALDHTLGWWLRGLSVVLGAGGRRHRDGGGAALVSGKPRLDRPRLGLPGSGIAIEPVVQLRALDLQVATDRAFSQAGQINATAAGWTAASVLLSAMSAVLGAVAGV